MRGSALLIFVLGSLPVCFVRPFYGILLWTVIAFLNPQSFVWGSGSYFPWALAVAIPTLIGVPIFVRGWAHRLVSREFFLVFALWIWFTITSVVSTNTSFFLHHAGDTWFRWGFVSKILLMTVVTMAVTQSFRQLRILMLVIAGCFGFFVLKALPFIIMTGGEFRLYGPENSMVADNNDLGLCLNMTLPFFFFLAQTEPRRWVRRLFGFLFIITIPAIFFTYSRGAFAGLAVVLLLMLLRLKQRFVLVPVIGLSLMIAVLFAPEAWKQRMDLTDSGALDASAISRFNAWTFSWRLALDFPVTGGGFATFTPELFDRYAPHVKDVHGPHSIYFGVLAEHGFTGLLLYLVLVGSCFAATHKLVKHGRFYGDQQAIHYAHIFQFSLIGFLVSGAFLGRAYFDYFFTIVACIAILRRVCALEWAEVAATDPAADEEAA
jgi:putative inorganic carbon (HCO3(-)) transporter